jgi:circadian clock protein KaiB
VVKASKRYVLKLFVAGASDRSRQAVLQVRHLCETRLGGRPELEVIDVHQHPEIARACRVPATPALVRDRPRPMLRFFGDLGDEDAVCADLGLTPDDRRGAAERPQDGGSAAS